MVPTGVTTHVLAHMHYFVLHPVKLTGTTWIQYRHFLKSILKFLTIEHEVIQKASSSALHSHKTEFIWSLQTDKSHVKPGGLLLELDYTGNATKPNKHNVQQGSALHIDKKKNQQ